MAADMGVFAALCWVAERRRGGVAWAVALGGVAVGAAVYGWAPEADAYRGMSGVDSAVFGYLVVSMVARHRGLKAAAWLTVLALAIGRFVFETATGRPLLPTSLPDGIAVIGIAHLAGLAAGCLTAAVREASQSVYENPVAQPPSAERPVSATGFAAGIAHPRAGVPHGPGGSRTRSQVPRSAAR
jgi:hypothetical protein